jgi:hypothetical protein
MFDLALLHCRCLYTVCEANGNEEAVQKDNRLLPASFLAVPMTVAGCSVGSGEGSVKTILQGWCGVQIRGVPKKLLTFSEIGMFVFENLIFQFLTLVESES